jgi:hypothetical protein
VIWILPENLPENNLGGLKGITNSATTITHWNIAPTTKSNRRESRKVPAMSGTRRTIVISCSGGAELPALFVSMFEASTHDKLQRTTMVCLSFLGSSSD